MAEFRRNLHVILTKTARPGAARRNFEPERSGLAEINKPEIYNPASLVLRGVLTLIFCHIRTLILLTRFSHQAYKIRFEPKFRVTRRETG